MTLVEDILEHIFWGLKASIHTYQEVKSQTLKKLNPIVKHFDLIDILIVWTILVIIFQRILASWNRISKEGNSAIFEIKESDGTGGCT